MEWSIARLAEYPRYIETVAEWQFNEWGALNSDATLAAWMDDLRECATAAGIPTTFLALSATADNELLGTASLVTSDMETRTDLSPWLAGVFVRPQSRAQGIGAALVQHVVAEAEGLGIARLYLYTHASRTFYERLGWRAIEQANFEGQDVTIMVIEPALTRRR